MRSLALHVRSPAAAIAVSRSLLSRARDDRTPWVSASIVEGRAILLGAAQRAGRVADIAACAQSQTHVLRRATTGTAAYIGGRGNLWTLALPHLAALLPDTSARTLLNRNIRGFLRGLTRAGAPSHYFGREWISVRQRPAAVMGFDVDPGGAVLIEVCAGYDQPIALPASLAAPEEQTVDRWLGKSPAALGELFPKSRPEDLARTVLESIASHAKTSLEVGAVAEDPIAPCPPVARPDDPVPEGFAVAEPQRIPIGWLDVAVERAGPGEPRRAWLGGDVLAPLYVLRAVARAVMTGDSQALSGLEDAPIEGAALADLSRAVERAAASIGTSPG